MPTKRKIRSLKFDHEHPKRRVWKVIIVPIITGLAVFMIEVGYNEAFGSVKEPWSAFYKYFFRGTIIGLILSIYDFWKTNREIKKYKHLFEDM